jgi:type IV pilus assembly protein PilV
MRSRSLAHSGGFNLVEVMVALVVISVGLLGIAKMQALALASTGTARMRSLAALEAASLATTIRADRVYWSALTQVAANPFAVSFQNGVITASTDATLQAAHACNSAAAPCTSTQIVAYDLQDWAVALNNPQLPNSQAVLTCALGAAPAPVSCTIVITWTENRVGVNAQSTGAGVPAPPATTFTLYVEP